MKGLRAPFVFTATIAAFSACGDDPPVTPPGNAPAPFDAAARDTTIADSAADDGGSAAVETDTGGSINPAECPATDPGIGANHKPCTAPSTVRCAYEDLCPQHPTDQTQNVYACHDDGTGDHWTLVSKDYVPSCPASEPKTGDPCPCTIHMGFVACNYGLCEDFTRTYAACKGVDTFETAWKVTPIACNPPEPDGGLDADAGDTADAAETAEAAPGD